jgi:hypothetical protein
MSTRTQFARHGAILAVVAIALLPLAGTAQAAGSGLTPGPWRYSATIYGYLPSIGGKTSFPADSGGTGADSSGPGLDIDANTIIDNLKMTFMGSLSAHNGQWGVFTDLLYLDVGANKSATRDFAIGGIGIPASATADLSYDMKGWIWTLAGQYRVTARPDYTMDLLAGARMFEIKQRLDYTISGDLGGISLGQRAGRATVDDRVWDAIFGVKGRYAFGANRQWSVPYYLDVGAGQSKMTWQGAIGIAYGFRWGELSAMWRYIGYDFKSDKVTEINFNGPMVGATFRW